MGLVEAVDTVHNLYGPIAGIVFLIVWSIRLESKVNNLETDHKEHKDEMKEYKEDVSDSHKNIWEKYDALSANMSLISQSLARIEGMLLGSDKNKKEF